MKTKVDLRELTVDRETPTRPKNATSGWHLLTRFLLPVFLLFGFGLLIAFAARESFYPPRAVTVVPMIVSHSELIQPVDTPLFRSAGWVEPRPTLTVVTALAEGIVDKLLVVEGQQVKEGDVVACLITADARLALDTAEMDVKLREGELAAANASYVSAKIRLEQPLHLKAELAEAQAALARVETELGSLTFQVRSAEVKQRFAKQNLEKKQSIEDAISEATIRKAKSDLESADAIVVELQGRQKNLPIEVSALRNKKDVLSEKLLLKMDEIRQLGESGAMVQTAEARLKQSHISRDIARLKLERMEVRAPISGRVLTLVAKPGTRLMGQDARSLQDSSTVVTLYDPASLQLRVDVHLDDVGKVTVGQKVKIETAALPGRSLEGVVLAATSQADTQKNTLAVKVSILEPSSTLRPDMLCQVTFLAPPHPKESTKKEGSPYRLLLPKTLVESSSEGGKIWIVDLLTNTARLRGVKMGLAGGDLIEVTEGLDPTSRLIVGGRDGLKEGDRVKITGEDENLGIPQLTRKKNTGTKEK